VAAHKQVAVPAQDRVRPYQEQELPQPVSAEVVEHAGENRAVGAGEHGFADLALQDQQLMAQRQNLNFLRMMSHQQQAQEREGVRDREVGQTQQHDRS
jgi:hypothetical protein